MDAVKNNAVILENTKLGLVQIPGGSATVAEALAVGGADFVVEKTPIYDGFMSPIEGFCRIGRTDNGNTLHVTKSSYQPIQNTEIFGVLNDLLGPTHAQVERVGVFNGGKVVFLQAKMPERIEVLKGDGMDMYINAITSHDGTQQAQIFFGAIRACCKNQMRAISKHRATRQIEIRHTKNAQVYLRDAASLLMAGVKEWDNIKENAEILSRKSVNRQQTKEFIEKVFPAPVDTESRDHNAKRREMLEELIETGMGTEIAGVKGTAWGLYNGATEWLDHHAPLRGESSHYFNSMMKGDSFRDQVMELAMSV